jgi:magnesium transporter
MITAYRAENGRLVRIEGADLADAVWIDMEAPAAEEERAVEAALKINIPTREDMQEIEHSSRLYQEGAAHFLTAQILATRSEKLTEIGPVTFVLLPDCLVTVHYHHPGSLGFFAEWAARHDLGGTSGLQTLLSLVDTVVDRLADILEAEARKLDALSTAIFEAHRPSGKTETLAVVLQRIGRAEDLNSKTAESLTTLQRLTAYQSLLVSGSKATKAADKARMKTLMRDIQSLQETAQKQNQKILFLLESTLGVINIRQSDIIKIFSVVAFVFLPPTLIASVYGMNFEHMPELTWAWGYPMAIGLMVASAVVPWLIFRWKKLL